MVWSSISASFSRPNAVRAIFFRLFCGAEMSLLPNTFQSPRSTALPLDVIGMDANGPAYNGCFALGGSVPAGLALRSASVGILRLTNAPLPCTATYATWEGPGLSNINSEYWGEGGQPMLFPTQEEEGSGGRACALAKK